MFLSAESKLGTILPPDKRTLETSEVSNHGHYDLSELLLRGALRTLLISRISRWTYVIPNNGVTHTIETYSDFSVIKSTLLLLNMKRSSFMRILYVLPRSTTRQI
jgi:hypothetical protein